MAEAWWQLNLVRDAPNKMVDEVDGELVEKRRRSRRRELSGGSMELARLQKTKMQRRSGEATDEEGAMEVVSGKGILLSWRYRRRRLVGKVEDIREVGEEVQWVKFYYPTVNIDKLWSLISESMKE